MSNVTEAVKTTAEAVMPVAEEAVAVAVPFAKKVAYVVVGAVTGVLGTLTVQKIARNCEAKKLQKAGAPDAEADAYAEDGSFEEVNPTE